MDEKVLEEIESHQEAMRAGGDSPLHQIRQKEMEFTGAVFAARNQADKMISEARQRALEIVRTAHADAERLGKEHADEVLAEVESSIVEVKAQGEVEVEELGERLAKRQNDAADYVVKLVSTV